MSMSKKIFAVVALLVAVAAVISTVSIVSITTLDYNTASLAEQAERGIQLLVMDRATQKRAAAMFRLIVNTDPGRIAMVLKEKYEPTSAEFAGAVAEYKANIPGNATEEMKSRLRILQGLWDAYTKEADVVAELAQQNTRLAAVARAGEMSDTYNQVRRDLADIYNAVPDDSSPEILGLRRRIAEARVDFAYYRWASLGLTTAATPEAIQSYSAAMKEELEKAIAGLKAAERLPGDLGGKAGAISAVLTDKCVPAMNDIIRLGSRDSNAEALQYYISKTQPALDAMDAGTEKYIVSSAKNRAESKERADQLGHQANLVTMLVAGIGIVLAGIMAYVIVSRLTRQLNRIIDELSEASVQVADASGLISSSSSKLADGAAEQAASLEETSSSLEEMASMTRKNADNANLTSTSTGQMVKLIDDGTKAVGNMSAAMTEISDSAEKISHIIKTIEEISFQTNLLALNAAVEAARAGEAGKGFAVVADEVRNLAQRAAQAARDTSELIKGTVTRVRNGEEVAAQLESGFKEIDSGAKQVGNLITEITAATNEQAQGVDQINTAVGQMDKVTQANAANSEECASASEELSAQAEALKGMMDELVGLVTGGAGGRTVARAAGRPASPKPAGKAVKAAHPAKRPPAAAPKHLAAPPARHEDAIPMGGGDDDFKDF